MVKEAILEDKITRICEFQASFSNENMRVIDQTVSRWQYSHTYSPQSLSNNDIMNMLNVNTYSDLWF